LLYYKNILIETKGEIYDPTEIVSKIALIMMVGGLVEKNKGVLFKKEIKD
jgi:hypothetical protein